MEGSGQPSPILPKKPRNGDNAALSTSNKRRNREHTNSRAGCSQCKARKVKCDEEKPKCRACTRRATSCTYLNEINGLNQLASAASAASSPYERPVPTPSDRPDHSFSFTPIQSELGTTPSISSQYLGTTPITSNASSATFTPIQQDFRTISPKNDNVRAYGPSRATHSSSATPKMSPLTLNLGHLELLHHFVAVTSDAITLGALGQEVWKMTVPKIALSHDWLMHSILAVSALHIAHLNPEQQDAYWKRAAMHQDQALRGQQMALANPSRENGDALYASTLTIIYLAFASPSASPGAEELPLHQAVQCLHMLRGISAISSTVKPYVEQGPFSHLHQLHPGNIKCNSTFSDTRTEAHFSDLLIFSSTNTDLNEDREMNDVGTYAAAASSLRASFLKVESVPEGWTPTPAIWHWAVRLPASFVTRVGERQVVPLVLIAHWCVLLTRISHFWWNQGWVDRTLGEIKDSLPETNHQWLQWPSEKISEIRAKQVMDGV